jgi:RNA polymerase sigma-70 factor, ECF subfamily
LGVAKTLIADEGMELVRRCLAGDGGAWEEIVSTYTRRIYSLAYRFTSNATAAEDLTQEAFLRVYRRLGQYDPQRGELSHWLLRVARNVMIENFRHRQRFPHESAADDLDQHTYHLKVVSSSPQREVERQELCSQVQAAVDKLPLDLRTCIILRDLEELSYHDIVDLLQIPEGTVKSRINRGRIKLSKILKRKRLI